MLSITWMGDYLVGSRGTAYAASKFAVAGFTESLALELEEFGITATIVGPGYFRTDVLDKIPIPRLDQVSMDLPVVAFTLVAALVTGIAFGVVPAFVSTTHARNAIREGGRHGGGPRRHRVLRSLVVAEVALSLVLLAGAGLLMRSLVKLQSVDVCLAFLDRQTS
jgi:putative ABC transport system permease protein